MSDLDDLKKLLFGAEKQALDSITERVESIEVRTSDVSAVLPEAIHQSHSEGRGLKEALSAPVGECLHDAIHEDPQTYGDALYPVMGPAIRKSILHTLRAFAQQINEAIEHSFTPRGLSWRLQAWRAGIPFGQFVLQRTLQYRVEQAYLISRENGLLISHAQHESSHIKDSDAVSAMFTAIQDFVKESFSPDRTDRLESADMGEFTLWAVHGPHALLVCVIRGVPPKDLRGDLSAILERIHFRHAEAIRNYSGDTASVADIEDELAECLRLEARQADAGKTTFRPSPAMLIVLAVLLGLLGWYAISNISAERELARLATELDAAPGIYVAETGRDGGSYVIRGLRDPLADEPADIALAIGVEPDELSTEFEPYQSLEPSIIARRAAQVLDPPEGVSFEVTESTLEVSGPAPLDWQEAVRNGVAAISGVDQVTFQLSASDRAIVTRQLLAAPESVLIESNSDGALSLTGSASSAWISSARTLLESSPPGWPVVMDAVVADELAALKIATARLDDRSFYFADGVTLVDGDEAALAAYAADLIAATELASELDVALDIGITGFTDRIGDDLRNEVLAEARVARVLATLSEVGLDETLVTRYSVIPDAGEAVVEPALRRATIRIAIAEPQQAE